MHARILFLISLILTPQCGLGSQPTEREAATHAVAFFEFLEQGLTAEAFIMLSADTRKNLSYFQFLEANANAPNSMRRCKRSGQDTTNIHYNESLDSDRPIWSANSLLDCSGTAPLRESITISYGSNTYYIYNYSSAPVSSKGSDGKSAFDGVPRADIDKVKTKVAVRLNNYAKNEKQVDGFFVRHLEPTQEPHACLSAHPANLSAGKGRVIYIGNTKLPPSFHSAIGDYACAYTVEKSAPPVNSETAVLFIRDGKPSNFKSYRFTMSSTNRYLILNFLKKPP